MDHELCLDCYQPYPNYMPYKWCKECNAKQFQQDFPNWTSGNEFLDRFIQETQLNAQNNDQILEWIPYNRFKNIEYHDIEEFNTTIHKTIWLDGPILYYERKWIRQKYIGDDEENLGEKEEIGEDEDINSYNFRSKRYEVALKSFNKSSNLSKEFLNEV